jgi:hypothetical protein
MPQKTRLFGIVLTLMGIIGYLASGMASVTALIPAIFGIIFIALGRLAEKESLRKHVMHVAVLLAVVGLIGTATGIPEFFSWMGGDMEVNALAASVRSLMALLCVVYIGLGVKSFIDARRTPA